MFETIQTGTDRTHEATARGFLGMRSSYSSRADFARAASEVVMFNPGFRFLLGVILAICGGGVAYFFTANLWLCLAVFVGCLVVWGILANLVQPRWYRR